jgi:hypothetical protein
MRGVAASLGDWSSNVLGDLGKRVKKAKKDLEVCRRQPISDASVRREAVLSFKAERLEEQLDLYWRQRAHVNWLEKGDRNTAFFHHYCLERKKNNRIGNLRREEGSLVEDEVEKRSFITNYFLQLFKSGPMSTGDTQQLLDVVAPCITGEMNEHLMKEFTPDEIKLAVDSIGDLKAPGPDGLPAIFFKKFWDVIGDKLTLEVLNVLDRGWSNAGGLE